METEVTGGQVVATARDPPRGEAGRPGSGGLTPPPVTGGPSMESSSAWADIEDTFFARGVEEERAAMEQHDDVVVQPRRYPRFLCHHKRHIVWGAGAVGVVVVGVLAVSPATRRHHGTADVPTLAVTAPASPAVSAQPASTHVDIPPAVAEQPVAAIRGSPSEAEAPLGDDGKTPRPTMTESAATADQARPESVAACREALERKQAKAITASCGSVIESDASLAVPLLAWARGEFERSRAAIAVTWARRVLHINTQLADAYVIVGFAEQEAGHRPAAKAAYRRYLELAPTGSYARDVRSVLSAL